MRFDDLSARIDLLRIGIDQYLEQHPWMVTRCPAPFIGRQDPIDIHPINDIIDQTDLMILCHQLIQARRQ